MIARFEVAGASMEPTLRAGQRLLILRSRRAPHVGEVWVLREPVRGLLAVKRVQARVGDAFEVRGDNVSASTDSAAFGPVERARFVGRVLCRYRPWGRVR